MTGTDVIIGTRQVSRLALPLPGALFGGALATGIGLRPTLFACAAGAVASGLFVFFSPLRHIRDVPQT